MKGYYNMFSVIKLFGGAFILLLLMHSSFVVASIVTVISPDKSIILSVGTDNDGRAIYGIDRKGKTLISMSHLGFLLTDSHPMVRGFALESHATASADEIWEQPWGERRFVRDNYNELTVRFKQLSGMQRVMIVRFRVFDNGVGFRYEIPDQPNLKTMNIAEELTEFDIAQKGNAWWITGGEWNRYEQIYQKSAIDAVSTAHTPITMQLNDGTHLSFHEASLVDYSAMWFKRADGQKFRSMLSQSSRGAKVIRQTPFSTPWRTIRIADSAGGLVENDLELNLNEPNKLGDVSWVKPYKYIGIWWGMHLGKYSWATGANHGATTERTKTYIDFAAKHGFRGVLVEGWNNGWDGDWFGHGDAFSFTESTPDFDLLGVSKYARMKGVRLVGHHETGGNIDVYERQLEDAMALYEKLGIDSVKSGYVADAGGIIAPGDKPGETRMEWHDGQRMSVHHLNVVKTAAKHRISVNPHEPIKDTGLRRTYPNWVSREGARGMEYNAWGQPDNGPGHEPTLVFTRMLSGPMDFTPGVLSLRGRAENKNLMSSTLARQLALYIVLYSPIQMAADLPENLIKYPRELEFIAKVPTDWSESRVLAGEVGAYAILARKDRASNDWYAGGVTDSAAREMTIKLDFLDSDKTYAATLYRDAPDTDYLTSKQHSIIIETKQLKKSDTLKIRLAAAGGIAIRFAPVK
jgi:alpha-glucosidase